MSNDGLIIENMDMSHIHLAVEQRVKNGAYPNNIFLLPSKKDKRSFSKNIQLMDRNKMFILLTGFFVALNEWH